MGHTWEKRNSYRSLVWKAKGKSPFVRLRRRWKDNMKTDLKRIVLQSVGWINLAEDRDQWRVSVKTKSTFGSHKMQSISWLTQFLITSQEGFCFIESFIYLPIYLFRQYIRQAFRQSVYLFIQLVGLLVGQLVR